MTALPMVDAARELGISSSTLRRWVEKDGAPVASRGRRGRGKATLIYPDAIRRWRAATGREQALIELGAALPELIARAMSEAFKQMAERCQTGGERRRVAAALAVGWFQATAATLDHLHRLHPAIAPDPRTLPQAIARLREIAAQ